jgi:endo-1,4-beta-xylanase
MNSENSSHLSNNISRRHFIHGLSASGLLLASSRAQASDSSLPSLRKLAGGRPLIGVAVPTNFEKSLTQAEIDIITSQFDSVTPENCMKWQNLCRNEGEYNFEQMDKLMEFAKKNQQSVVGHTLIFNRDGDYPKWLHLDNGNPADSKLVWKRVEDHLEKVMSRYSGRIESWDVLNEFIEVPAPGYRETQLTKLLGADYPERLFKLAAQLDPKAKLIYNDFSVENPQRLKAILNFVRSLRDKGCRVDIVGSQSHFELDEPIADKIDGMIKQFAKEGFSSALTELDVDVISRKKYWGAKNKSDIANQNPYADGCPAEVLERQADFYRKLIEVVMTNRKDVTRVTLWGITDRNSWLNKWPWERVNHGLLFDREAKPKPAFHAFANALSKKQ